MAGGFCGGRFFFNFAGLGSMSATPRLQTMPGQLSAAEALELWFLSGVGTFAKSDNGSTSLPTGVLDSESIWALHLEKLLRSGVHHDCSNGGKVPV